MDIVNQIKSMLNRSHSPFHAVKLMEEELIKHGFIKYEESKEEKIVEGGKYYTTRNGSSLFAVILPSHIEKEEAKFLLACTHTDSPSFKVKPNPVIQVKNNQMLEVEAYGGGIYNTWMDRPLTLAGRVQVLRDGKIENHLFYVDDDLLIIPNVAIHMNRNINTQASYNPAVDMKPLFALSEGKIDFNQFLLDELNIKEGTVLSHDLFLTNREEAKEIGKSHELLGSMRLDDLASAYTSLLGFLSSKENDHAIKVFCSFDNEEVGSLTRQGANSTFLKDNLHRILASFLTETQVTRAYTRSFHASIDNAHANHPNHPELSSPTTDVQLGKGIVIKYNANQSYTTDSLSGSIIKAVCLNHQLPYQEFTNRSDMRGGSTLGNISNSEVSLLSADIGLPQLAMHSCYEVMGKEDLNIMVQFVKALYESDIMISENEISVH